MSAVGTDDYVEPAARDDASLRAKQPYTAYENDLQWLGAAMVKHFRATTPTWDC